MNKKITTERHYRITLTGGSTYYGRTTQPGDNRYDSHQGEVRRGVHGNKHIQESYNKYGYDDWVHDWLGWETGDLEHHRQIEFGRVQADPKSLNIKDGKLTLLSKEERIEYKRVYDQGASTRWLESLTPKQHDERKRKQREYIQQIQANETPEQKEKRLEKQREYDRRKRDEKKRGGDNK